MSPYKTTVPQQQACSFFKSVTVPIQAVVSGVSDAISPSQGVSIGTQTVLARETRGTMHHFPNDWRRLSHAHPALQTAMRIRPAKRRRPRRPSHPGAILVAIAATIESIHRCGHPDLAGANISRRTDPLIFMALDMEVELL